MNLNNLLGGLGIKSNLAGDVSFLIIFLLISFVVSFALGKHRILVSLLGVYAAYMVVNFAKFDFLKEPSTKTLVFLAVLAGFILFFSKIIRGSVSGHGPMLMVKLALGTAIVIGLSLSIILNWYTPKELADIITPGTRKFFTDDIWRFGWGIAPLVYLAAVRKRID
jgi:site-specific recombinase